MSAELSSNAQAILLLTAPLIIGRSQPSANPLTPREYRGLVRRLRELKRQPADLLGAGSGSELKEWGFDLDAGRLVQLLGRGFLLAQAMERWRTRAIWVVSRADSSYPPRFKKRLGEEAPPVVYGCGDAGLLDAGGLAVVGSRNASESLLEYTTDVGRLTATARSALVSGGARGVDQAAMHGALEAGGRVAGVLGDGLEKAVMRREYREALIDGRLILICPYDPAARFQVGHAMQRNKLIYALADAALVVNSDYEKGGTWTGAVEQLDKLRFVPVFIRSEGKAGKGLDGLRQRGAKPWPNPKNPEALGELLSAPAVAHLGAPDQQSLTPGVRDELALRDGARKTEPSAGESTSEPPSTTSLTPAEQLFGTVREILATMDGPRNEARVAECLQVSRTQAGTWLKRFVEERLRELFTRNDVQWTEAEVAQTLKVSKPLARGILNRLVEEGAVRKLSRPTRYRSADSIGPLFDR